MREQAEVLESLAVLEASAPPRTGRARAKRCPWAARGPPSCAARLCPAAVSAAIRLAIRPDRAFLPLRAPLVLHWGDKAVLEQVL